MSFARGFRNGPGSPRTRIRGGNPYKSPLVRGQHLVCSLTFIVMPLSSTDGIKIAGEWYNWPALESAMRQQKNRRKNSRLRKHFQKRYDEIALSSHPLTEELAKEISYLERLLN